MAKVRYVLSEAADKDIEEIFDYTNYKFGFNQAVTYLENLEEFFQKLVEYPELGRARDELKVGLYSLTMQSHVVFYRILNHSIRIVRVMHKSKDVNLFEIEK
ncbi:MAG: type II toxin-antitoxin system RelE/ParE family toxin [Chitinophagales bacterium]